MTAVPNYQSALEEHKKQTIKEKKQTEQKQIEDTLFSYVIFP